MKQIKTDRTTNAVIELTMDYVESRSTLCQNFAQHILIIITLKNIMMLIILFAQYGIGNSGSRPNPQLLCYDYNDRIADS